MLIRRDRGFDPCSVDVDQRLSALHALGPSGDDRYGRAVLRYDGRSARSERPPISDTTVASSPYGRGSAGTVDIKDLFESFETD
jgi:hypothetical protein